MTEGRDENVLQTVMVMWRKTEESYGNNWLIASIDQDNYLIKQAKKDRPRVLHTWHCSPKWVLTPQ